MNTYINFFGQSITWYSILGFCGLILGLACCIIRRRAFDIPLDDQINLAGYAIVGAIIGAKLLALLCMVPQFITYSDQIAWNQEFFEMIMRTGFVYYGGLGGVILAFYIYCRQYHLDFRNLLELIAPAVPLFHAMGRVGCYIAGCCGGKDGFPLQLVASILNLCLFFIILIMQKKKILVGKTFLIYLLLYGVGRFSLEFFRGDPERGFIGCLSVSQWISIGVVALALISTIKLWKAGGRIKKN